MTTLVINPLTITDLTDSTTGGAGVFDSLMRAHKAHLDDEYKAGRIKGADYATVYLGSLQSVLNGAIQFLLERDKTYLQAQLQAQQIVLAEKEIELKGEQVLLARAEVGIAEAKLVNLPKEGALLDAQAALAMKQVDIADEEVAIKQAQVLVAQAEVGIAEAKLVNIPKEGLVLDAQAAKLTQDTANALTENAVLVATECKLRADFDHISEQTLKSAAEKELLNQKKVTEMAQVTSTGIDADSVIGRQKSLYQAQTDGYKRDSEQKAADLMMKSWATRRTTDAAVVADVTNKLSDTHVGRAIEKMLLGINA